MRASLNGVSPHIPEGLNIQHYNCNELKCITASSIQPFTFGLHGKESPVNERHVNETNPMEGLERRANCNLEASSFLDLVCVCTDRLLCF